MSRKIVVHPEILFGIEVRFKRKIKPTKVWLRESVAVEVVLHDSHEIPVVAVMKKPIAEIEYPLLKHGDTFFAPSDERPIHGNDVVEILARRFDQNSNWQWREAKTDLSEYGVVAEIVDDRGRSEAVSALLGDVAATLLVRDEDDSWRIMRRTTEPVLTIKDVHHNGRRHAWVGVEFPNPEDRHVPGRWRLDAEKEARASRRGLDDEAPSGLVRVLRPDLLRYDHDLHIAMEALGSTVDSGRRWLESGLDAADASDFAAWIGARDAWSSLEPDGQPTTEDVAAFRTLAAAIDRRADWNTLRELDRKLSPTRWASADRVAPPASDGEDADGPDEGAAYFL